MFLTGWKEAATGVWSTSIGNPKGLTPLSCLNRSPRLKAISDLPSGRFPLEEQNIRVNHLASGGKVISIPLDEQESLYGTGLQFMRMNQRGRTRFLRVNSDPRQDTGETHAPVPFLLSEKGYGILVDSSRVVTFYCGSSVRNTEAASAQARDRNVDRDWRATLVSDQLEIVVPEEGANIYLFAGPTMQQVIQRYNLFCGGGVLPPRWGLGFWHRTPTLYSEREVAAEAMQFRERGIPCDVIGLEPGWHSASYPVTYEWDPGRFPDPEAFIGRMKEAGFRVNLWEHPYLSPKSALYSDIAPFSGSHSVWGGLAPDYTMEKAQQLYMHQHDEKHISLGASGYKLDECDGSELTRNSWMFPPHAEFPSGHDGEQMRQLYGLLFQDMTDRIFRSHNQRTYGLARASNAGASSLPYVLYSDLYDHRQFVRALCNASFSGLLWSPEVRKAEHVEDWVRRMQTVCFSPLAMLNAWGDGVKPWSYPEAEGIVRHYIRMRMALLPYLYTVFAVYEAQGIPPFRAMPLVLSDQRKQRQANSSGMTEATDGISSEVDRGFDTAEGAYGKLTEREWDDQFCIGNDMLIAPLFAGEIERDVLLPDGVWYEAETGERYAGGQIIHVTCPLERIPVFIREGAIIPLMPALDHVPSAGEPIPVEMVHFGQMPGESMLYDDDGETFDFERDGGSWRKVTVSRTAEGNFEGVVEEGNITGCYVITGWRFGQTQLPDL